MVCDNLERCSLSVFILLIALTWIPFASAERTINNCPIPDDMKIVAPDENEVPPPN